MGFIAALRQAEEQGKTAAKLALGEVRQEIYEAETALRRRMRVHPQPGTPGEKGEANVLRPGKERAAQPIVSIHGRDVSEEDIDPAVA